MNSITDSSVVIQTSSSSVPSTPSWFGEVVIIAQSLRRTGMLAKISERVRFTRRRFGRYEVIDFVAVQIALRRKRRTHARSLLRELASFCDCLHGALRTRSLASPFDALALFDRSDQRASRSPTRPVSLTDLLGRQPDCEQQLCGLTDRAGNQWKVFDIDGTRQAARQRAFPQTPELPVPQRRLADLCAPGYTGRKRGEIVRTRTTVWASRIRLSGSAPSVIEAMESTERSCAGQWRRSSPISARISCPKSAPFCGLTVCMQREPSWPICSGSPSCCVARTTRFWTSRSSRRACTCLPISSSGVQKVTWSARAMTALT